jgi:hypothetical protein
MSEALFLSLVYFFASLAAVIVCLRMVWEQFR